MEARGSEEPFAPPEIAPPDQAAREGRQQQQQLMIMVVGIAGMMRK